MKPSPDLYVNLDLPSDTLWAKTNLDASQANGFAISEFQYGCSFVSWGNVELHSPVSASEFDYDWGTANESAPWYVGQPYGETPGSVIQRNLMAAEDAARNLLGRPWRLPTSADFDELLYYTDFVDSEGVVIPSQQPNKLVTINGIQGVCLKSKINGATIFFACCGFGRSLERQGFSTFGGYWSSTYDDSRKSNRFAFDNLGTIPVSSTNRCTGLAIRPVWKDIL